MKRFKKPCNTNENEVLIGGILVKQGSKLGETATYILPIMDAQWKILRSKGG